MMPSSKCKMCLRLLSCRISEDAKGNVGLKIIEGCSALEK